MRNMPIIIPWIKVPQYLLVILVALTKVVAAHSCEVTNPINIEELKSFIKTRRIGNVRIFSRSYKSLTPMTMRAQDLEEIWEIDINPQKNNEYAESILQNLSILKICKSSEVPDLYWGIVIYNVKNERIFSAYFEREYLSVSRVRGKINNINVSIPKEILSWFETRFPEFESRQRN